MKIGFKSFKQIVGYIWLMLANLPMPINKRWKFIKLAGVKFTKPSKEGQRRFVAIGKDVTFDTARPWLIEIGNGAHITTGCVILTHFLKVLPNGFLEWEHGPVKIEEGAFLGAHTIITKSVTIGRGAIVGAGSIVTKDIPPYEVWAGNPARFIKKLNVERS